MDAPLLNLCSDVFAEEVEHFAVEFVAFEVFVGDVGAFAVEDAETAAEVP